MTLKQGIALAIVSGLMQLGGTAALAPVPAPAPIAIATPPGPVHAPDHVRDVTNMIPGRAHDRRSGSAAERQKAYLALRVARARINDDIGGD